MRRADKLKGGKKCKFTNDHDILAINSPESRVNGPYLVVHKDAKQRYALVALDWDKQPRVGIRWFWDAVGNPQSTGYPTWTVLPNDLYRKLHGGFSLSAKNARLVEKFLAGKMTGEQLRDQCG